MKSDFSERLNKLFGSIDHLPKSIMVTIYYPSGSKLSAYNPSFVKIPDRSKLMSELESVILESTSDMMSDSFVGDEYPSSSEIGLEDIPSEVIKNYNDEIGLSTISKLESIVKSHDPKAKCFIEIVHDDKTNLTN